jgi:hypothetical protein
MRGYGAPVYRGRNRATTGARRPILPCDEPIGREPNNHADRRCKQLLPWLVAVVFFMESPLVRTFDKSELVRAMSFVAIPGPVGPMLGPIAGGLIVDTGGHRVCGVLATAQGCELNAVVQKA